MKYLILGNGAAGTTAADKIRELDKNGEIKLISADDSIAYAKIMLPDYIGGKITRDKLFLRNEDYYKKKNIELIKGREALKINFEQNSVELDDGSIENYDKLLIATGSIPFVPHVCGLDMTECITLNSLKDADSIKNMAKEGQVAIVLGGGLTGIETSFALARLGVKPYLIEKNECILASQLNKSGEETMKAWLKKDGVETLTGMTLKEVVYDNPDKQGETTTETKVAVFTNGQKIKFDMFIFAIGTRPNVSILKDSPINLNRGIIVDKYMNTNIENVFAAGDIAQLENGQISGYVSPYIWPNAMAQGKCAAYNMCNEEKSFLDDKSSFNPTLLRDMPFYSIGLVKPIDKEDYEIIEYQDKAEGTYKKVVIQDNTIKGFTLIGDTNLSRKLNSLLRNKGTRGQEPWPDLTV